MFNNAIIKGDGNTVVQKIVYNIGFRNIKGFLNQINGREKSIKLLKEKFYIDLSFEEGKSIEELIINEKSIIVGNPGSGKTIMMINLFFQIKNKLNKFLGFYCKNEFIPFFIALRDIPKNEKLEQYIENKKKYYGLNSRQKFILLIDGLDEINIELLIDILDFINNNQNHRYIISSRKSSINLGILLKKNLGFNEYTIKEFNFDIENGGNTEFLENYFKNKGKKLNLSKYKKLQIEIKDIFYLELFFEIYEKIDYKDGRLELIEKFLEEISEKNNELISFGLKKEKLFKFLSDISGFLYENNTLVLNEEDLEKMTSDLNINNKKYFIDYIIKTFFIKYESGYSFYHKTFYEYFFTIYITEKYNENKLSIREGNILFNEEYIIKIFFSYVKKTYMKEESYSSILSLNLFMQYYLYHNPIDEFNFEKFIKSLFSLSEELLRFYIFEKKSTIYESINNFNLLNYTTIKIALDKGYIDIAEHLYNKLNKLINKKKEEVKLIKNKLQKNKNNNKKFEFEKELQNMFSGLNYKNKAFVCKKYGRNSSYIELWNRISRYNYNIYDDIYYKDFNDNPIYSFFDDLIKFGEDELIEIIEILEKKEFYVFLQKALYLENIVKILGNKNIFEIIKKKFIYYKGNFKEFINLKNQKENNDDNSVTLFCKYIFGFYKDKKEIFESKDYSYLKEGHGGIFDEYSSFHHFNLNKNQLTSYLFFNEINMKKKVEDEYYISIKNQEGEYNYRYQYGYSNKYIYIYSYSIFIESFINNKKIDFKRYIKIIKEYSSMRHMDSLDIKNIYSEILAYIYYYNIDSDYISNLNIIWENLYKFIDKISFYKKIQEIDNINNKNKIQEIISENILSELLQFNNKNINYPLNKTEDYFFISEMYGKLNNYKLQNQIFNRGIANSYVRYGFRKDSYLIDIFGLLEILKNESIITEIDTFKYIDKIINLYRAIEPITEKGVQYLGKYIIKFISEFSIEKAEEYKEVINDIDYSYYDEINTIILIQKIKNNTYNDEEIKNIFFSRDPFNLLEMKIYLYLIKNGREDYIELFNNLIINFEKINYIEYYWEEKDFMLYEELYKNGKIKKSNNLINLLKEKKESNSNNEKININGLNEYEIIKILNEKMCYHYDWFGSHNYLLEDLYLKDEKLFYKYISLNKYKYYEESKLELFLNYYQVAKIYIKYRNKKESIKLFNELLDFAKLLIM